MGCSSVGQLGCARPVLPSVTGTNPGAYKGGKDVPYLCSAMTPWGGVLWGGARDPLDGRTLKALPACSNAQRRDVAALTSRLALAEGRSCESVCATTFWMAATNSGWFNGICSIDLVSLAMPEPEASPGTTSSCTMFVSDIIFLLLPKLIYSAVMSATSVFKSCTLLYLVSCTCHSWKNLDCPFSYSVLILVWHYRTFFFSFSALLASRNFCFEAIIRSYMSYNQALISVYIW